MTTSNNTFKMSVINDFSYGAKNVSKIHHIRDFAKGMYLQNEPKLKRFADVLTLTVQCDTPHEKKLLEKMSR